MKVLHNMYLNEDGSITDYSNRNSLPLKIVYACEKDEEISLLLEGKASKRDDVLEFEKVAKPLIKWINDNCNPHTKIIITCDSAEVVAGVESFQTDEYIKD